MIPVLFDKNYVVYTSNGLGRLTDVIDCVVNETLDGEYECTMIYPCDGIHAEDIAYQRILYVKPNQEDDNQAFRITKIKETMDGRKLTVTAKHISYDLNGFPINPYSVTGASNALNGILTNTAVSGLSSFFTEANTVEFIDYVTEFSIDTPRSARAIIGGDNGITETFKCNVKFDNFAIHLMRPRGSNNGVVIRYGKNLESFVNVRSTESAYSGMFIYYKKDSDYVSTYVASSTASSFAFPKAFIYDATSDFDTVPSTSDLSTFATNYMTENGIGQPYLDTVTVSFIPLWQTEEYKFLEEFETVGLGDTVTVIYNGYTFTVRAVSYTFDVLKERYRTMVLGEKKTTLLQTIRKVV